MSINLYMSNYSELGSRSYLTGIVVVAILGGLLFGYDTAVMSGAENGLQAYFMKANDFQYAYGWDSFINVSTLIGCVFGSVLSGLLATCLGRKQSLILAGLLLFVSALGSMRPEFPLFIYNEYNEPSYDLFIIFNVFRSIGGVGIGLASAICPMYIGEVAPSNIRGMLVSWNKYVIILGLLVVFLFNYFLMSNLIRPLLEQMAWRYMFGSEAIVAALFILLICFVPETPRYLVSIGRYQMALGILGRINGPKRAQQLMLDIKSTMAISTEQLMAYGAAGIFSAILIITISNL